MGSEHRCPDCGEVYPCLRYGDKCQMDYELRCSPCQEKRARHYRGLSAAFAAYAKTAAPPAPQGQEDNNP